MSSTRSGKASQAGTKDTQQAHREHMAARRAVCERFGVVPVEDRPEGWKDQPVHESGDPNRSPCH
jgi:hypothetical protein